MNILLLHNNNMPAAFRLPFETDGNVFRSMVVNYPPYERRDFDTFLCAKLSEEFLKTKYDLIILPYTLGEENYSEYSGLRLAAHIRLTKEWNHFAVPILFLGGDDILDVMHFSDLGGMLASFRIFTSTARTKEELSRKIDSINCNSINLTYNEWLEDPRFQMFLNRIHVEPPANYATHHSVANKWAVLRWIEMFSWNGETPKFVDEGFKNMLFFKCLMANAGVRELYKNKSKKKDTKITWNDVGVLDKSNGTRNRKRIIYIDDEESMWGCVLYPIFQKSDIDYIPYHFDRQNKVSKKDLIQNIKSFLKQDYDTNGGADCYLIDLRLHDDDFAGNIKSEDLSGQQIAKYIKKKIYEKGEKEGLNEGCQIVVFTASNKSWNVEESVEKIGACGYVIKESPEMNYSRDESYLLFCDFSNKIKQAFKLSYLQHLYRTLDNYKERLDSKGIEILALYEYADLLNLDKGANKSSIIKSCALHQYVFLENLIQNVLEFRVEASGQILKKWVPIGNTSHCILMKTSNVNGHKNVVDIKYMPENKTKRKIEPLTSPWEYLEDRQNTEKPFDYMIAALLVYYGINVSYVKKTVYLGHERNTAIAHGDKETRLTILDLQAHFENVIIPILQKETDLAISQ